MPKLNLPANRAELSFCALMLLAAAPVAATNPWSILWTAPAILLASMMIAWGAEAAQFFMAQGFALLILAWMQTLPEFAVEAVLAWRQQTPLLIANLTGAIRLLTGLGWPMIYCAAAISYRRKFEKPMRAIQLEPKHSAQVIGSFVCLIYVAIIAWKGSLAPLDAVILLAIYAAYIYVLRYLPTEDAEDIKHLDRIPRAIAEARRPVRIGAIMGLFLAGGIIIFFVADPFVGSLFAMSTALGVSQFIFIQWVAPFVSEFPEFISSYYWARSINDASMALMNMVSSNITQWTLLAALLPLVLSLSLGHPAAIVFDRQQSIEILMTLGQSLLGTLFLIDMELAWWEAALLFVLWVLQFGLSLVPPAAGLTGKLAGHIHVWTTIAYFSWAAIEVLRLIFGQRKPAAFHRFRDLWKHHVRG